MKRILSKILSLIVVIALLLNVVQLIIATANDLEKNANIVEMKFSLSENDPTYNGDAGVYTYWKIELTADEDISFGKSTYWKKNLQQYMIDSQTTDDDPWEEHNALADALRENIYINGISIKDGLATDPVNQGLSTRIQIGDSRNANTKRKLMIHVRAEHISQLDNTYGLNDYTDFTLEIKEGITLNGFKINPVKYKYYADTQQIVLDDGTLSVEKLGFKYNIELNGSKHHLFSMELTDKFNQITDIEKGMLNENIFINGKSLKEGLNESESSTYVYQGTSKNSDENMIYVAVKADENPYGIDTTADLDFVVKGGISFGEYVINPVRYFFSNQTERFVKDDGAVEFISAQVTEANSYITGGTDRGPVWVITLKTNSSSNIAVDEKNGEYWKLNLQQMMVESQGEFYNQHNEQAINIREKILINGVSVDAALKATNDCTTLINTPDANTLVIRVNKEKDKYGIDLSKGFTVSVLSGLKLGNTEIAPITYEYSNDAFLIKGSLSDNVLDENLNKADVTAVSMSEGSSCSSNHVLENIVVSIDFDKEIYDSTIADTNGANADLCAAHLQKDNWTSTNSSSYNEIRRYILINGKCLTDCYIDGNYSSWESFVHIAVDKNNKNRLIVSIPKDNTFGFDGTQNFEISILSGIKLNGYDLSAKTITYTADNNQLAFSDISEDKIREYNSATANDASIASVSRGYCSNGSHRNDSQWVITINFDKNLYVSDIYSSLANGDVFYRKHLQASGWTSTEGRESDYKEFLKLISLNDKTLEQCFLECASSRNYNNEQRFIHISADDETGKTLQIAIPTNNPYGFNGNSDFKISIGKGLKINGYTLNAFDLNYSAGTASFNIVDYSKGIKSNVVDANLDTQQEKIWVIELMTEHDITVTGNASNNLQFVARQRDPKVRELAQAIVDNVTINGETVAEAIERVGNRYPVRISATGNKLSLEITKKTSTTYDNDFYINNKEDFTVCIRQEIRFGDVIVQPGRWRYDAQLGKFVVDNAEDVKNIATSLLTFTGSTREEIDDEGKPFGILQWVGGTSRYVDFYVDSLIKGTSLNSEIFNDAHGESVRNCIYVDGISVNEWLEYGNQFQVMVRFEGNYIRFLLDGSREPSMIEDEYHWIEFKEGLISATGERVSPCKFYYDTATKRWSVVDSYENCNKPWWVENFEEKSAFAQAGKQDNPSYVRPELDWDEEIPIEIIIVDDTDKNDETSNEEDNEGEKIKVVRKKKVKGEVIYEDYFPVGAIIAICAGGVLLVGAVTAFIIVRKKHKNKI